MKKQHEELKKVVKEVLNGGKIEYSTTELRYNFIKNQKCSVGHANLMISKMYDDLTNLDYLYFHYLFFLVFF